MQRFCRVLSIIPLLILFPTLIFADTQQPGAPIQIGGSCSDADGSYLWLTTQKSLWAIQDASATPSGTNDPSEWLNQDSFHGALWTGLPQDPVVNDFAQRIVLISPNYAGTNGALFVSIDRTITTTTREVSCEGGSWEETSSSTASQDDSTDWLSASGDIVDFTDVSAIAAKIQAKLDLLNGQPGGNTDPVDGYVHMEAVSEGGQL